MSMTQTGSLVHVNISLVLTVHLLVLVYCWGWRDTTSFDCITPVPKNLLMDCVSYLVFELRWELAEGTPPESSFIWFWLNLENSLTLWREFERSQSSKNQYGSSIPRWIAIWMYHAEHNQWYQWKWQLRKLHTVVNNPVIAWYKQNVLDRWQIAPNSRGANQLPRSRTQAVDTAKT